MGPVTACIGCGELVDTVEMFGDRWCGPCIEELWWLVADARAHKRRTVIARGRRCRT